MSAISDVRSAPAAPAPKQVTRRVADEAAQDRAQAQARAQLDRVQAQNRTESGPPKEKGRYVDRHA